MPTDEKMAKNLAIVIPTNRPAMGEKAACNLIENCAQPADIVVLVAQNSDDYSFENLDSRIHLVRSESRGATFARNEGIDFVLKHYGSDYLFVFPNDQTKYTQDSIAALRDFASASSGAIALGVWHILDFQIDLRESNWMDREQLDFRDAFTAYEPAIAVPGRVFQDLRFDNSIGTGSATWAQSGEAPDLVLQALQRGTPVYRLLGFVAENPSTTYQLSRVAGFRKIYRYACGSGFGYRRWAKEVGLLRSYLQIGSPILSYLSGKVYWRTMGILNAAIATLGRIHGRFFISER